MNIQLLRRLLAGLIALSVFLPELAWSTPVGFSRSCRLASLQPKTKEVLAIAFDQAVDGLRLDLVDSYVQQYTYAFESITADYFAYPKVWLWSVSARYALDPTTGIFSILRYPASPWKPESVEDNNRNWLMSVRSGTGINLKDIWQYQGAVAYSYGVAGAHATYDSPLATMSRLSDSSATNCNCASYGFGWSMLGNPYFGLAPAATLLGMIALCT